MDAAFEGPPLGFLHVPKTAGTTLRLMLERLVRPRSYCPIYTNEQKEAFARMPSDQREGVGLFSGHVRFDTIAALPASTRVITILRDPIDRVASHYYWAKTNPRVWFHADAKRLSLRDYVSKGVDRDMWNGQTYWLSSLYAPHKPEDFVSLKPHGGVDESHLEEALGNLAQRVEVLCITERFEESLALLFARLELNPRAFLSHNRTPYRPEASELDERDVDAIVEHNSFDVALYEAGVRMFEETCASLRTDLDTVRATMRHRRGRTVRAVDQVRLLALRARYHLERLTTRRKRR